MSDSEEIRTVRNVQLNCHNGIAERSSFADANRNRLTVDADAESGLRGPDFTSDGASFSPGCAASNIIPK